MPDQSHIFSPEVPVHLILRSNNSKPCFYAADDYRFFLQGLQSAAIESSCMVHAYVLMNDHIHLLLTPAYEKSVVALIKQLGEFYSRYINRIYQHEGAVLGKRFNCYLIHEEELFLVCQKYIELNPVRSKMVSYPGEYPWSSYRVNAHGLNPESITPHRLYLLLGNSNAQRMAAYRTLFEDTHYDERILSLGGSESGKCFSDA